MLDYQRVNATCLVHLLLVQSHCALPLKVNEGGLNISGAWTRDFGLQICRFVRCLGDIIWILYGYYMDIIWILYGYYMDIIWIIWYTAILTGQWPITTVPQPMDQNPSLSDSSFATTQDRERLEIYKEVQRNLRERLKLTAEAPRRIARGWWGTSRSP